MPATEVYLPPARVLHVNGAKWVEGPPIKFLAPGEDIPGTANATPTSTTTASTAFSCQRHWNTSVFFLHPYFPDNSFHALNDNVFAVLASVALQHLTGAAAGAGDHRSLFLYRDRAPGGQSRRPTVMWRTLHTLFDDVRPARDVLAGGPHCVRHVAYAAALTTMHSHTLVVLRRALYLVMQAALRLLPTYPALPAPELRFPDDNGRVHRATNASDRSRSSDDRATQRTQPGQPQPPPPPRVVIITRNTTTMETLKKTIQRTLSRQSENALRDAFVARGAAVAICCDWTIHNTLTKQLAFLGHADVVVGIHGAGLANAVFAPMGSVVVELQDYGWGDMLFGMLGHASGGDYVWVDMGDMPHETNDKRGIGAILPQQMVAAIVDAALKRHVAVRTRRATSATGPAALIGGVDYSFRAAFAVDMGQPPATGTRNEAALLELLPSQPPGVQRMYVVQDPTAFGIDAALASGGGDGGGPPPGGWWPAPALRAVLGLWLRNASTVALCHRMPYYRVRRASSSSLFLLPPSRGAQQYISSLITPLPLCSYADDAAAPRHHGEGPAGAYTCVRSHPLTSDGTAIGILRADTPLLTPPMQAQYCDDNYAFALDENLKHPHAFFAEFV